MPKIVVNKHVNMDDMVSGTVIDHKGEILICNEIGNEGVFIKNNRNEKIKIGTNISKLLDTISELEERISILESKLE